MGCMNGAVCISNVFKGIHSGCGVFNLQSLEDGISNTFGSFFFKHIELFHLFATAYPIHQFLIKLLPRKYENLCTALVTVLG
jgi:hypothetical protein